MALNRKYSEESVESSAPSVISETANKSVLEGSKVFTSTFKSNFQKQIKIVDDFYSSKTKEFSDNQAILGMLETAYQQIKVHLLKLETFISEIEGGAYVDNMIVFKVSSNASAFLRFVEANKKIESFSFVTQSSDIQSMSDLFSKVEESEFACESVISVPYNVFASLRFNLTNCLKKFVEKWQKNVINLIAEKSKPKVVPEKSETKTKPKRTSTTTPRKPKKEKPPQERFIGVLVGYSVNEESQVATFKVLRVDNKSVVEMFDNLNNRLYYKALHNIAKFSNDGTIIPVVCYNWYKDISSNLCIKDYYPQDEYADFEKQYDIKVSALKAAYEEYINK